MTNEPHVLHVLTTDAEGRPVRYPQTQHALPGALGEAPRAADLTLTGQTVERPTPTAGAQAPLFVFPRAAYHLPEDEVTR